jgi:cytochrome c oxidase subunit 4
MAEHHHFDPSAPGHGYEAEATDQEHGHSGVGKYVAVFVALVILTAISFAVGNSETLRHNSPGTMWAMMMAVSCCKAMLVILFFMHILWEANWKYVLTIPASMMSIFLLLMLIPDIGRRTEKYSEERWLYAPQPETAAEQEVHAPGAQFEHNDHSDHAEHTDHAPAKH